MAATTTGPSRSHGCAEGSASPAPARRGRSLLPRQYQKSSKAGQFCRDPLHSRNRPASTQFDKAGFFNRLGSIDGASGSRAVAWDLISCRFSQSGCAWPPLLGKGVADTEQRHALAKVTVVSWRFGHSEKSEPENDPDRPNEPPDTPETPPDEPPPTPVEEPPPGKGPYVAGLDSGKRLQRILPPGAQPA